MSTKLVLTNSYGEYSVEIREDDCDIEEIISLVRSVLLSATYNPDTIAQYIPE